MWLHERKGSLVQFSGHVSDSIPFRSAPVGTPTLSISGYFGSICSRNGSADTSGFWTISAFGFSQNFSVAA